LNSEIDATGLRSELTRFGVDQDTIGLSVQYGYDKMKDIARILGKSPDSHVAESVHPPCKFQHEQLQSYPGALARRTTFSPRRLPPRSVWAALS
jgi:hypothetical protein